MPIKGGHLSVAALCLLGLAGLASDLGGAYHTAIAREGDTDLEEEHRPAPAQAVTPYHRTEAEEPPPAPTDTEHRLVSVGRGDTLLAVLLDAEVPRAEADEAIAALGDVYDLRKLRVGQQITLKFDRQDGGRRFKGLDFEADVVRTVSVERQGVGGFGAEKVDKKVERTLVAATGTIRTSLYEAGVSAGVPVPLMMALIRAYSYDVDFQRDLQPGDSFEILFERYKTEDGSVARDGDFLYAELTLTGKAKAIYRHALRDGKVDYFNRQGESVRKALLRTPVDGAKLTSSFGMRRHPILGYSKMHKGADFGAPTGTPIFAAGSGVIEEVGPKGAYGNYVRIRHNAEISTAYAHMSRFARDAQRGARVDQGDVIGYVGTTGRSTGPHLHYEVLKGSQPVNPMSVDLPIGQKLEGKELAAFQKTIRELDMAFARARLGQQMVENPETKSEPACAANVTC